jgi:hypothetical protein
MSISLVALKAKAAAVILALPAAWFPEGNRPETVTERATRITGVTDTVVDEAAEHSKWIGYQVEEVTALGLAFSYNESAFAWEVHAGKPWPKRPPPLGDNGHAACVFQLQPSASMVPLDKWRPFERDEWSSLVGLDPESTRRCVRGGIRAIAWHAHLCRGYLAKHRALGDHKWVGSVIAAQYHKPSLPCGYLSSGSTRRGRLYAAILYQLRKAN